MPQLIKGRAVVEDRWTLLRDASSLEEVPTDGPVIVPLALWQSEHQALAARGDVGVWLKPNDDPAALGGDIERLPLIAIDFPKFVDGRGYSSGRLLREQYRFAGELRAIGDVLRDQLYYLSQCGFDAFAIRAGQDIESALSSLDDFSDSYQSTNARPVPLFRRRTSASGTAHDA
jgi:uncharacterized protein (DUF934 family)